MLFPSAKSDLAVPSLDLLCYNFCIARVLSYSLCAGCRDNCMRSSSCLCNILTFPCVYWNSVLSLNKYLAFPWEELQELLPQCCFPAEFSSSASRVMEMWRSWGILFGVGDFFEVKKSNTRSGFQQPASTIFYGMLSSSQRYSVFRSDRKSVF